MGKCYNIYLVWSHLKNCISEIENNTTVHILCIIILYIVNDIYFDNNYGLHGQKLNEHFFKDQDSKMHIYF